MSRKRAHGGATGEGGSRLEGACAGPLLSGERKHYGRGRAEALLERPTAGVRVRALGHYSRGSGNVTEGGKRKLYRRSRRQA